jgi:MFS family permease
LQRWRAWLLSRYQEYHPTVWLLTVGRLLNATINFMAMPFLTLYLSEQGVDLAVIGFVVMCGPVGSTLGNLVGGQLADRLGRKPLMVAGLLLSGAATAGFSVASETWQFAALFAAQGLFGSAFWPSSRAAIADLAPPEKRAGAYGLWRMSNNLGTAIGPLLGAMVAQRGLMFALTGLADMLFAVVFLLVGVESLPAAARAAARKARNKAELRAQTRREWRQLLSDKAFLLFIAGGILSTIAYQQMFGNYSLYLKQFAANPDKAFAWLISLNGALVVLGQMPINWLTRKWSAGRSLVLGSLTYAASYAIFAIPGPLALVLGAGVVWTVGEMIVMTAQMTFVADIAPEELRGRYMGASSISWTVGALLCGPFGTLLLNYLGGYAMMLGAAAVTVLGAMIYRISAAMAAHRLGQRAQRQAPATVPAAQ